MINLDNVTSITHNNKTVIEIKDSQNRVIWSSTPPTPVSVAYMNYLDTDLGTFNGTLSNYTFTSSPSTMVTDNNGNLVWSDGTDLFYSTTHIWNNTTNTWDTNPYASTMSAITDSSKLFKIDGNIFFMTGTSVAVKYDKATHTTARYTISGVNITMNNSLKIWSDGTNTYYNNSSNQYQLIDVGYGISAVSYTSGISSMDGQKVWTDGTNIYYDYTYKLINGTWTAQSISSTNKIAPRYLVNYNNKIYSFKTNLKEEWNPATESFITTTDTFVDTPSFVGGFFMWDNTGKLNCNTMYSKLAVI